jgi:FkbM family methyltransferase
MKTLVYIGANVGNSLWGIFDQFDRVYAFEPNPEIFKQLRRTYKQFEWVTLVNSACGNEKTKTKFYVTPNLVSSSLSIVSTLTHDEDHPQRDYKEIEVDVINLYDYLLENGIDHIDCYISDAQGSDLNILKTLKKFIDDKKIEYMYIETHGNGLYLYDDLYNQFDGFKELLQNNYEIDYINIDRLNMKIYSEMDLPEGEYEWDTAWRLKS